MNILYISYSCDPFNGSEDQIGWNIPLESFNSGNKVFVLTKEEHKTNIESYLKSHTNIDIKFFFVDVNKIYKKIFKGMFYSLRIIFWQKRGYKVAKKICSENDIDIIHQVAPVEYRAYGNYGNISNVKYVAGPIGGGFPIPNPLKHFARKHVGIECFRKFTNFVSLTLLKLSNKFKKTDYLYITNEETRKIFEKYSIKLPKNELLADVGIDDNLVSFADSFPSIVTFFVPGRLTYRKGHELLLNAISELSDVKINFVFEIAGSGPYEKELRCRIDNDVFLKEHVRLIGKVPFTEMTNFYKKSSCTVLTSLSEATGTVLIESASVGRPCVTSNYFGAKLLFDNESAWLCSGNNSIEITKSFSESFREIINNPQLLKEKGTKAISAIREYTWKNKVSKFNNLYKKIMSK